MKLVEKKKAIELRRKGYSIRSIAEELQVSKASASTWVRKIELTSQQQEKLAVAPYTKSAVEKRRTARLTRELEMRNKVVAEAKGSVKQISLRELFYIGIALYWGEGTKKKRGVVEVTNSDPLLIRVMMQFFLRICKVPPKKIRGHLFIHEHMEKEKIEAYWSRISGIPMSQFHKTTIQQNRNRLVNDSIPNGTFAVIICDTQLKLKIDGWTEGMGSVILNHV